MRVLVWHWGRHGAGPRFAAALAEALGRLPGVHAHLSLAAGAEILTLPNPPPCDLPMPTYTGLPGLLTRLATAALPDRRLDAALSENRPNLAICAMPAPLDPLMLRVLRRHAIPSLVIAHDAAPHAGDGGAARALWDRTLLRRADAIAVLSDHVGAALQARNPTARPIRLWHPPFAMPPLAPPFAHGGKPRVLSFGRLRAYKGLDLLAGALRDLPRGWQARIAGAGPESSALAELRALPGVRVENRWIAETELPELFGWADIVLLTHRAASQSGVAAAALGAGRLIVATGVPGLSEQLAGQPAALLCPPDPVALARGLRRAAALPAPRQPDPASSWRRMAAALLEGTTPSWPITPAGT